MRDFDEKGLKTDSPYLYLFDRYCEERRNRGVRCTVGQEVRRKFRTRRRPLKDGEPDDGGPWLKGR